MVKVVFMLSVILFSVYVTEQAYFLQENFINRINEEALPWQAGVNFHPNTPNDHIIKRLGSRGVQIPNKHNLHMYKSHDSAYDHIFGKIPKNFDAREKWSNCETIREVRDEGNCGSSWAVATSSAFADRLCIATNSKFNQLLSIEEVLFCCDLCGFGCYGGSPIKAWEYFRTNGIVTGGEYNTTDGCAPYEVHPCRLDEDGHNPCTGRPMEGFHSCPDKCYGNTEIKFRSDHRYTRDYYFVSYGSIQVDIMIYGPVAASFNVYDDFINYKSGVYVKSRYAKKLGSQDVKIIGWGEENGIPYWLCMNSWNEQWGDNGLFKIRRGTNECGIDHSATAGVPKI